MPVDLKLPKAGANVIVRRLEERDLEDLSAIEADPEVKRYLGGPISTPRLEWIAEMKRLLPNPVTLAVVSKDSGEFAGRASIGHWIFGSTRDRDLQIVIGRAYWGRGFGREVSQMLIAAAFEELAAERIIAVVEPGNRASLALVQFLGFERDGVDLNSGWQDGHLRFVLPRPARMSQGINA